MKKQWIQWVAWGLSGAVSLIALIAWGQGYDWQVQNSYQLFPLFGLLAFSLMWSHYIASAIRQYFGVDGAVLRTYFELTSMAALAAILLHPGLLAWELWRDGFGLPPGSELNYVPPKLRIYIWIALISWLAFLAYEFRRRFATRSWWKYVQYASDIGMVLIFLHALKLGGQLQEGWFRWVWYVYGITFLVALVYGYSQKFKTKHS